MRAETMKNEATRYLPLEGVIVSSRTWIPDDEGLAALMDAWRPHPETDRVPRARDEVGAQPER